MGVFITINHGVPESLMKAMIDACHGFFNLPDEEKQDFKSGDDVLGTFKYGTSYNLALDKFLLWRDLFKVRVHPEFYSLYKPGCFSEVSMEFSKGSREVALEITRAISESLGLEPNYIYDAMNMDRGIQIIAANYYPPCPQPEHAIGIPHHTDHGLVTLLIQNKMNGLQVEHNGKWLTVDGPANGLFFNLADQMQHKANMTFSVPKIDGLLGVITIRLNDDNFVKWNYQLQSVLQGYDLYGHFDGTSVCPPKYVVTESEGVTTEISEDYRHWLQLDKALLRRVFVAQK
ncbi:PREDICTED: protein DMR6-LIKE OXYGENASE 1-like [Prunus mume]|uniref:Protein DMR6-LIKE OXYGENASE 1-like n=1 Tax=Prunus mume TaxID=102107 RepID=A0ABM0PBH5_PRUMU|nr:PREDICTED: protein DMR6-LIKE OXYGENASE 1-like [Prunus mume]